MNTWVVGKIPVGHHAYDYPKPLSDPEQRGEKTFYIKARIMAGKAKLDGNKLGLLDHQWLTKDEINKMLSPFHWSAIKNALTER